MTLFKTSAGYFLCTGNSLKSGGFSPIERHINKLNEYTKEELNSVYLDTLKKNALIEDNKAGVGLIDVRRYNHSFIDYETHNDDQGMYLSLGVLIPIFK